MSLRLLYLIFLRLLGPVVLLGLIAQTRRRTICGTLLGAGLERLWQHSRARRFFATARWSTDQMGLTLADLIGTRLLPTGAPITIAVDDTLFKRSGKKVFGVAWRHDGAAKGPKSIGFGNCWPDYGGSAAPESSHTQGKWPNSSPRTTPIAPCTWSATQPTSVSTCVA